MTKLSLSCSESLPANRRPRVSALPPGPKGTMVLTGRDGYGCATTETLASSEQRVSANRIMGRFYNQRDARLHRRSYSHRPREFSTVRRQGARRALAVDGAGACLPPPRDDLGQG